MKTATLSLTLLSVLAACGDRSPSDSDSRNDGGQPSGDNTQSTAAAGIGADGSSGDDTSGNETGEAVDPNCVDDDFIALGQFEGPGYHPETGLVEPLQDAYIAHVTVGQLRPDPALEEQFIEQSFALIPVLMQQEGLVGYQLGISNKCKRAMTIGVWRNTDAMMQFVITPEHVKAMSMATEVFSSAGFHHFDIPREELPFSFEAAREVLEDVELDDH